MVVEGPALFRQGRMGMTLPARAHHSSAARFPLPRIVRREWLPRVDWMLLLDVVLEGPDVLGRLLADFEARMASTVFWRSPSSPQML